MLLNEQDTKALEERIKTELRFRPDAKYRGHSLLWWRRPVRLPKPWAVYALDEASQEQIEQTKDAVSLAAAFYDAVIIIGSTFAIIFGEPMKGSRDKYLLSE